MLLLYMFVFVGTKLPTYKLLWFWFRNRVVLQRYHGYGNAVKRCNRRALLGWLLNYKPVADFPS